MFWTWPPVQPTNKRRVTFTFKAKIASDVARAGIEPATFRFSVTHFTAGQTADLTQHAPGVPIAHDFTTIVLGSSSASPRAANRLNSSATFRSRPSTMCRYRIAATDDE